MKKTSILTLLFISLLLLFYVKTYSQTITIFEKNMSGYACFRIPAIVISQNGSVLAFAEARKKNCSDTGDIDIVMRRSTDGGNTWSSIYVVRDNGENVSGNPVPIVNKNNGNIVLVFCENRGVETEGDMIAGKSIGGRRVFVCQSYNDGESWSTPIEITKNVKKDDWTWYATGPCHGIQLQTFSHKGRLVVPSNHVKSGTENHFSQMLYSDDNGITWHLGNSTTIPNGNESCAVELPNGNLILNMRNMNHYENHRLQAISTDGGATLQPIEHVEQLLEPVCQGSVISYSTNGYQSDTLLFSNPNSKVRKNMTIKVSTDAGKIWHPKLVVNESHSAYSDMAIFPNGDVAIIYENGENDAYDRISFKRVSSNILF